MTLLNSRMIRGQCPVCGGEHAACGPPSDSVPFDQRMEVAAVGGPLENYEVTLPGGRKTTMKLNEDDARRYGVLDAPDTGSDTEIPDQPAQPTETETPGKSRTTRNKARTTSDKGDG